MIDGRIASAIVRYSRPDANPDDRRHAANDLASVLEDLRARVGTELPRPDEDRLFEIANSYAIRHLNGAQKTDYDEEIWMEWIFTALISGVRLSLKLIERNGQYRSERCPACHQLELTTDVAVDFDKNGAISGTNLLICANCGWTEVV